MSAQQLGIGAQIGPFRIIRLLGEGGVGRVYAALDTDLGRMVALKALRPELNNDTGFVDRFRSEAASLARLQHPNITTLYALHRDGRAIYMVMELVRGYTLEEVLQREGRLRLEAVRAIAAQACAGLGYAHRMGVIHRDIKTSNLMLTESGQLKIMDFGIARVRGSQRMTRAGSIIGTLAYMPPEQIKGSDNDERSDIYSLACVFYELLCGTTPFRADTEYELIQAQIGEAPSALAGRCRDIDHGIEAALMRALAKSPGDRFANAAEFAQALGATNLARDPADTARDRLLERMPKLDDLAAGPLSSGGDARMIGTSTPGPVAGATERRGVTIPLPAIVLGGAIILIAAGFGAVTLRYPHETSSMITLPQAAEEPAPSEPIADPPSTNLLQSVPPSTNIFAAPDAQSNVNAAITSQGQPSCSPDSADAGVTEGHVDGVSDEGWPQINGSDTHLYGVRDLDLTARARLTNWLSNKGNDVVCCTVPPDTHRCLTARTHQDVGLYLLINGLAHSDDAAPQAYRDAEADARSNHRGLWK